jgi:transcriptional regulator with XRE-family HTH domain
VASYTFVTELGQLLRDLRKSRRWTLAHTAQIAGIARSTLNRWETGVHFPRLPEIEGVLLALGASPQQRRKALQLIDAPRAVGQIQADTTWISAQRGIGQLPNKGDLLRALRLRRGISLQVASEHSAVSTRTIRFWEKAELWPSASHLHTLCLLYRADEKEIIALTCGPVSPVAPAEQENQTAEYLLQELTELVGADHSERTVHAELGFFILAQKAWRLATEKSSGKSQTSRETSGRLLLSHVYSRHASYLSDRERFEESGKLANHALEVFPVKNIRNGRYDLGTYWLAYASIAAARSAAYRPTRPAPAKSIELLKQALDLSPEPHFQAWILSDIAIYLSMLGGESNRQEAISVAHQARSIALRCEGWLMQEWLLREKDLARVLIQANRPAEALSVLQPDAPAYERGIVRADVSLLMAEAQFKLGRTVEAETWLTQATHTIESGGFTRLLPRTDALFVQI